VCCFAVGNVVGGASTPQKGDHALHKGFLGGFIMHVTKRTNTHQQHGGTPQSVTLHSEKEEAGTDWVCPHAREGGGGHT
jgi:hypothetical protein